ncbi:MAG: TrmB family transcriptional regulator [Candidatus Nezhaarchaeales archaeon]
MSNVIDKLKELGLTEYESKVYYALIKNSGLTAEEISKASNVPLTRVYSVLTSLQSKGMVLEISGRPKRFEAVQPKLALRSYASYVKSMLEEELHRLEAKARELSLTLEPIYWNSRLSLGPPKTLKQLSSFSEMETYTKHMITSANQEIDILTYLFTWFDVVKEDLVDAITRGVEVKALIHRSSLELSKKPLEAKSIGVKVRLYDGDPYLIRGTITDFRRAVFALHLISMPGKPVVALPYYTENIAMTKLLVDAFNYIWLKSHDLEV